METIRTESVIDEAGRLRMDVATHLPPGAVEVVVVIQSVKERRRPVDFSDLAGRLEWRGDPLAAQREMRNEW